MKLTQHEIDYLIECLESDLMINSKLHKSFALSQKSKIITQNILAKLKTYEDNQH